MAIFCFVYGPIVQHDRHASFCTSIRHTVDPGGRYHMVVRPASRPKSAVFVSTCWYQTLNLSRVKPFNHRVQHNFHAVRPRLIFIGYCVVELTQSWKTKTVSNRCLWSIRELYDKLIFCR